MKNYKFASKRVRHSFCPECGTSICVSSDAEGFFPDSTALNVSLVLSSEFLTCVWVNVTHFLKGFSYRDGRGEVKEE
jgi:hypothetical protein